MCRYKAPPGFLQAVITISKHNESDGECVDYELYRSTQIVDRFIAIHGLPAYRILLTHVLAENARQLFGLNN